MAETSPFVTKPPVRGYRGLLNARMWRRYPSPATNYVSRGGRQSRSFWLYGQQVALMLLDLLNVPKPPLTLR